MRLVSKRSQRTSKCGKNKKVAHEGDSRVCYWFSYHILKSSVICYWADARQNGIYLFYILKKETTYFRKFFFSTWLESLPLPTLANTKIAIGLNLMWNLHEIIHIWTAVVDESEEWSSQLIFQFKQLERRSLKKKNQGFNAGFEPVTSAIPVRCSTNWAMKPHIGSEVNLLSSYLPVRSEMMWNLHEIIHIWTAVVDESEEWSSQLEN